MFLKICFLYKVFFLASSNWKHDADIDYITCVIELFYSWFFKNKTKKKWNALHRNFDNSLLFLSFYCLLKDNKSKWKLKLYFKFSLGLSIIFILRLSDEGGYPFEFLQGESFFRFIHAEDTCKVSAVLAKCKYFIIA